MTATAPGISRPARNRSSHPLTLTTPRAATTGAKLRSASDTPSTPRPKETRMPRTCRNRNGTWKARVNAPPARAPHASASTRAAPSNPKYTAPAIIVTIIAKFQKTGATNETKNVPWLLRIPSAQAAMTKSPVIGKRIRTSRMVRSWVSGAQSGKKKWTRMGASAMPARASPAATVVRMPRAAPANRAASSSRPCSRNSE